MACFIVPAVEAVVTTIATKVIEKKEDKDIQAKIESGESVAAHVERFSTKMKTLNKMLWGGTALLAVEHIWHGEVVPFFPFLTALKDPADTMVMLHEMSTVGVLMAVAVTLAWGAMLVTRKVLKKDEIEEVR